MYLVNRTWLLTSEVGESDEHDFLPKRCVSGGRWPKEGPLGFGRRRAHEGAGSDPRRRASSGARPQAAAAAILHGKLLSHLPPIHCPDPVVG